MPWVRMVRHDGQDLFRLRPQTAWAEIAEIEVAVWRRAGRAREAREIIGRLTRARHISQIYRPRHHYRFSLADLRWLEVVCAPHLRAVCCNQMKGGARCLNR